MILNLQDNDKDDSKQSRYPFNQSQIYGIQKKKQISNWIKFNKIN